jgi:hypothetical protein
MIWHPLLLSVLAMDLLAAAFTAAAALSSLQIAGNWSPKSADEAQIALERKAETASLQGRAGCLLLLGSTLVLVIGIAAVLPDLVPGAMCGTGVLQATRGAGGRALAVRALALGLLAAWHLLDRMNRSRPDFPLATAAARALLLASPAVFLAVCDTVRAVLRLDVHRPVDCCSILYDRLITAGPAGGGLEIPESYVLWGFAVGGAALLLLGIRMWRASMHAGTGIAVMAGFTALLWTPAAASALVRTLAAYHYGVLQHRCPWCLFLPDHGRVGYPLFGALIVVALEAGAALVCSLVASRVPTLADKARARTRAAGFRIALATALFLALSGLPPILWRLRFGVWMEG